MFYLEDILNSQGLTADNIEPDGIVSQKLKLLKETRFELSHKEKIRKLGEVVIKGGKSFETGSCNNA